MVIDPMWAAVNRECPDARARRSLNEKKHRLLGWMSEIFCVNCGTSGGMITQDWAAHVFYLCDECAEVHGRLPLPDLEPLVRGG